jgi:hypothetical protein
VGVKRGENDVPGMISSKSNMIDTKMKLVDGLPGSRGLVCSHWNRKEVAVKVILYHDRSHRALTVLSYNTPECRFNIGDKTIKRTKEKLTIGKDVVRDGKTEVDEDEDLSQ